MKDVYHRWGMVPTWPVMNKVDVGQIISRTAAGFSHEKMIQQVAEEAGIHLPEAVFAVSEDGPNIGERTMRIMHGATVEAGAGASAKVARVKLRFQEASSYLFLIRGGGVRRFAQMYDVRQVMLDLQKVGAWQKEWQLITWVRTAENCAVFVAQDPQVVAEADLRAGIPLIQDQPDLNVLDISSSVTWTHGSGIDCLDPDVTPLHQALRVRRWLRPKVVGGRVIASGDGSDRDDEDMVDVVGPADVFPDDDDPAGDTAAPEGSKTP